MEQTKCVYDQVGSLKFKDMSYKSTHKMLADVEISNTVLRNTLDLPQHKAIQAASTEAARSCLSLTGRQARGRVCIRGSSGCRKKFRSTL